MPDFQGDRRRQPVRRQAASARPSKRELSPVERQLAVLKEAPPAKTKKEHPNEVFRRLLRDFQTSLAALRNVEPAPVKAQERILVQAQPTQARPAQQLGRERRQVLFNTVMLKEHRDRERLVPVDREHFSHSQTAVRTKETVERTIRMPGSQPVSRARPQTRNLPLGDLRRYPGMTGADREAIRQVSARHYDGSPEHLPSAARLAQILRADALLSSGEGQKDPRIRAWAKAIKSGQRRAVADMNPRMVQSVLNSALGGSTKAEQLLHTPMIERLIERHRSNMSTIHEQLRQSERAVSATHSPRSRLKLNSTRHEVMAAPKLDTVAGLPGMEAVIHSLREGTRGGKTESHRPFNMRADSSHRAISFSDRHKDNQ